MNRRLALALAAILVLVAVGAGALVWSLRSAEEPVEATGEPAPSGLEEFYAQDVAWQDCGERRTCADVQVPLDYAEPGGERIELSVTRYAATGVGDRTIFVNPGGPGGSAVDFAGVMASTFGESVREEFAVVGVDPRGVGESEPVDCLDDEAFDEWTAGDPDPDPADDAEVRASREKTRAFSRGCAEKSGDLAAHVSTEEAARDMDVVRALVGSEEMNWFGASYGTQLGATYATLFPERVGAMVLDGAVDPSDDAFESALGQTTGFQRALEAYLADCVSADGCPLGDDAEAAEEALLALFERVEDQPLPTDTDREVTEGRMFYGVAVALYDKRTWPILSQALTLAERGDGSLLLRLHDAYFSRQPDGTYDGNIGEAISVINCLDARDEPSLEQVRDRLDEFTAISPVFGRALGWGPLTCTDWTIEGEHPQVDIDATGSAPIVVVGTTRDPATPYENAPALADQLGEDVGVLLTREGDGHTAYTSGNRCIAAAVDAYLVDGTVPEDGLTCPEE